MHAPHRTNQEWLRTENLRTLRSALRVAKEVGKGLGERQVLLTEVQGLADPTEYVSAEFRL